MNKDKKSPIQEDRKKMIIEKIRKFYIMTTKGKAEQRLKSEREKKEERLGRKLTKEEEKNLRKRVIKKIGRERQIRIRTSFVAIFAVLSLGIAGKISLNALNSGDLENKTTEIEKTIDNKETKKQEEATVDNKEKTKQEETTIDNKETTSVDWKSSLKTPQNEQTTIQTESPDRVILQAVLEYNNKYGTNLTPDDLSYIESEPSFIGVREDGTYVQDFREIENCSEYISKEHIYNVYIIINNKENKIIASVGRLIPQDEKRMKNVNIDTNIIMLGGTRETIVESDKKIDLLTGKTDEEKEKIYETIKALYYRRIEKNNESERGLE